MSTKSQKTPTSQPGQSKIPAGYLIQEYERWQSLFHAQPTLIQRFFETQARGLADALLQLAPQARFSLPVRVVVSLGDAKETAVPNDQGEQVMGWLIDRFTHAGIGTVLRQRLDELEASTSPAVATASGLLRFVTASVLVHERLPSGRSVRYQEVEGEEIPSLPVSDDEELGSAITATADVIAVEGCDGRENGRGKLLVPYVPAARRFFLPQWVALDEQDRLLVHSVAEAEALFASMQRYVRTLHSAVSLAPYMVADNAYQQKRYGMLGQLVNQGRALARFETREIIATIRRRAAANNLNRGLSLSLPYFNDQGLEMKLLDFDVIPAGRVMFIPAFVVLAVRNEQAKVEQDTRLNRSTRNQLLAELRMLEEAFLSASQQ